ncbi:MAG: hypothetical protein V4490_03330, partial [Pseudomonadota bacterium]
MSMHQEINLFDPPKIIEPPEFCFAKMVGYWKILTLSLCAFSGALWSVELYGAHKSKAVEQLLVGSQAELDRRNKEFASISNDGELTAEIDRLKSDILAVNKKIDVIKDQGLDNTIGFSGYLKGLARNHVNGAWYTKFSVTAGGHYMELEGSAT